MGVLLPGEELDEDGRIVKNAAKQAGQAQNGLQGSGGSGTIRNGNFIIPVNKLTAYALDYDKDPNKAKAFESALGYTQKNANDLIVNIMEHVSEENLIERGDKGHGMRYESIIPLTGANGKIANVLTAWIRDEDHLRLTSVYVTRRKSTK